MGFNKPKLESKKRGAELPTGKLGAETRGREMKPLGFLGVFKRAYARLNEVTGGTPSDSQSIIQSLPQGVVEAYAHAYERRMIR
jgi:hypothetical protein